ncbi:MAG: ferrochelatase [Gammaproteobacteria bacterium]|nr:ferrochelatase [Gammaproteobacteria bacterium]NNM14717.1 ferrochelatase [Gammaproteobacteria bacterium]
MKKGLLLINLGTPAAPTKQAVKIYLKQFLSDPNVVSLPKFLWQPILNGIVLKTRPAKSAEAYAKIWTDRGSPLLVHAYDLAHKTELFLNHQSEDDWHVAVGMSYGCPCIRNGLQKLKAAGVEEISILPMYPQYSTATTKSVYADIQKLVDQGFDLPALKQIPPYYQHPDYITALADSISAYRAEHGSHAKLLLSYHGLPESYVKKGDPYQEQCNRTTELLVEQLGLQDDDYLMTFQSRFGAAKWLQPYTDVTLEKLAQNGTAEIDTVCPGFAADCLETLEEIAIQNAELYYEKGGRSLRYIPALNASEQHAQLMSNLALNTGIALDKNTIIKHARCT